MGDAPTQGHRAPGYSIRCWKPGLISEAGASLWGAGLGTNVWGKNIFFQFILRDVIWFMFISAISLLASDNKGINKDTIKERINGACLDFILCHRKANRHQV